MINVMDLPGVVGDGVSDDTEPVRKAIRESSDNETIYFPQGKYLLDTLWVAGKNNLQLCGEGHLIPRDTTSQETLRVVTAAGKHTVRCRLAGLTIGGKVVFNGSHFSRVTDCVFPDLLGVQGIMVFNSHDVILTGNRISGRSIGVEYNSADGRISSNEITTCATAAIRVTSANLVVDNNRTFPYPGAMQTSLLLDGQDRWMKQILVTGNNFGHPSGYAIHSTVPMDRNRCLIVHNQFLQEPSKDLTLNVSVEWKDQQVIRMARPY